MTNGTAVADQSKERGSGQLNKAVRASEGDYGSSEVV